MKRFLSLLCVFLMICMVVSCSKKKKDGETTPEFEEQVSKEIKAEEGGTVESSDGKTSVEIPADALDADTTITMTIYNAEGYKGTEGKNVVSKVVEFEPSGTIFKKPVIISMTVTEGFKEKIVAAAVYDESKGEWSYSEHGAYALLERDAAGNPVMTTAAGDPIMLNAAGEMTTAAGDPIMNSAAGDPIMLASAGDPIMTSAAGDPIMNSAAGDPIMMTTGHFTSYTFFALDSSDGEPVDDGDSEPAETDDDEPVDDGDTDTEGSDDTDDDTTEPDEDTTPVEPAVYSKVICTGLRTCVNAALEMSEDDPEGYTRSAGGSKSSESFECPGENDEFYGQDANYISRKSCVPQSFERLPKAAVTADDEVYQEIKDNVTGLIWLYTGASGSFGEMADFCSRVTYDGRTWRLPTPKEFLTIVDSDDIYSQAAVRQVYFQELVNSSEAEADAASSFWTSEESLYFYNDGSIMTVDSLESSKGVMCVSGGEYGKIEDETIYEIRVYDESNGEETVFDSSTNLLWQKSFVSDKTWKEALEYCEGLEYGGYSDWRLPNKNELATLLDYSKMPATEPGIENPTGEEETEESDDGEASDDGDSPVAERVIISSFPGMTANVFVSSTPKISVNESGAGVQPWAVSMYEGRVDYVLADGEEGEGPARSLGRSSGGTPFSVRCVRSDLTAAPADGIPECDEKIGYTPCKNGNTVWSPRIILSSNEELRVRSENGISWREIAKTCRRLTVNGKRQWRIPSIDELRTLVTNDKLKTGGTCRVTTNCLDRECYDETECSDANGASFESKLRDFGVLVSGDGVEYNDYSTMWAVYTSSAAISEFDFADGRAVAARCVLDETLPDYEFPYTQNIEEGINILWSDISPDYLTFSGAAGYCSSLSEGGTDSSWRVPTVEDLSRLLLTGEFAMPDTKGKNTLFGDVGELWSSDEDPNNQEAPYMLFNFMFGYEYSAGADSMARVRCVSGGEM